MAETIIEDLKPLVRALAGRVYARLPRGCGIELADLVQAGNIGLLQAARTFKSNNGVPLACYAKFRIRGEMLDTVRRNAGSPRVQFTTLGETGQDKGIEDLIPASPADSPHSRAARREWAAILDREVERLPPRYRTVVRMRYVRDFSLRDIGAVLHVGESRACQLHQSALGCLREALSRHGVEGMASLM